ncbi:HAMP domain-containing sensor histidine kinase [Chamaesiphon sp. GL140_3_metabinner_50]|uniref:sensor histidine kinase n=1 Tax=Chamaesiphon sp. GL140_3_metabinner_50 TaxID=2970812 RepID=UPI0025E01468|nr:HAMP domain-containing sensor histidine kinase [Chamaesiphon sp. GL140_3_metabinner_50]
MQDSREIDYFGQRILQIVQPLAAGEDRTEVLALLAQSIANNFAADGCWILQYNSPDTVRVAASACISHRTSSISERLPTCEIPVAPTPIQWRMPLLPDYHVTIVETRNQAQVTGCVILATKGVEWYRETKLILQIVADYVGVALIEVDLQSQAKIASVYPLLHQRLTQAIVEKQPMDRLFEVAVSDMVLALELKRGLVLTLKAGNKQPAQPIEIAAPVLPEPDLPFEVSEWDRPVNSEPTSGQTAAVDRSSVATSIQTDRHTGGLTPAVKQIQVQIVTEIDVRPGERHSLPPSFLLENSQLCKAALANAPNPTIFDGHDLDSTSIDRLIFQDDRLPSIAMIPLMGTVTPDRQPADAVWGWLVLQHDRSRQWHPVELKLLQAQILQIALARIQRRALKQARNAIANRTSQVQTSLQLQAKLHDVGRKRMEKLRQANDFKDEFISTIGHELRTPLTSMSLAIKMLRQADVDPARREQYLDILEEQCQREIKLVNDILKLQQLESHQLEFRPQQIGIDRLVSEQATIVAERWQQSKEIELSLHLPSTSSQIETDADSLKHIIEELLINAGKFAIPKTMVEVWLTIEPERAIFKIANLSKPIASADLPNLFERFRRGEGVTQQAIAGTGLGLALVKSMVDHIQGTIVVESTAVEPAIAKTSFTVAIPTVLERH